jgi:hypothetical protein
MYTPPAGHAVNFNFSGSAYTPPAGHAVNFSFTSGGGGGGAGAGTVVFIITAPQKD